jgi:cysteinyl-tRNA synthetase
MVDSQKMAKSAGNFYTLRDLLAKGWTGREVRYALITVNYRLPLNFTFDGLAGARSALGRIDEWVERMRNAERGALIDGAPSDAGSFGSAVEEFFAALDDDLNISGAMGHLFDLIRDTNRALDAGKISPGNAAAILEGWKRINSVLGMERDSLTPSPEVLALVEERQFARANKQWSESDRLRDAIAALGWVVKDTKDGPKLTPKS